MCLILREMGIKTALMLDTYHVDDSRKGKFEKFEIFFAGDSLEAPHSQPSYGHWSMYVGNSAKMGK